MGQAWSLDGFKNTAVYIIGKAGVIELFLICAVTFHSIKQVNLTEITSCRILKTAGRLVAQYLKVLAIVICTSSETRRAIRFPGFGATPWAKRPWKPIASGRSGWD